MNSIKKFIIDFIEFRRIRNYVQSIELSSLHKNMILSYNTQYEKELNSLILKNLMEEMLSGNLSEEYVRWAKSMLTYRQSYIAYKSKFNQK